MAISSAVTPSARAGVIGIQTLFKNLRAGKIAQLPAKIGVIGQGSSAATYATTKLQVTSQAQAGTVYGFGSPIHLAVKQLLPDNGDGVGTIPVTVYPMVDDGAGVVSSGDITPSGPPTVAASYTVRVNNIDSEPFVISVGDSVAVIIDSMVAAINAVLSMPIIAVDGTTLLTFTSKWKGVSANDIFVEVVGSTTAGNAFAITQANGGLVNPSVQAALDQFGADNWETLVLNCLEATDTTTLGLIAAFNEGRWGALTRKPFVCFAGSSITAVASAIVVPDVRTTDRTNVQLMAPTSRDLPLAIAARQLARIAVIADSDPAHGYQRQRATGLTPGPDGDQWTFADRDLAVKAGCSSTSVVDGVINLADIVTMYHPVGEVDPAYRFVVTIVKLQTILHNLDLIFDTAEWAGAPLIPDGQRSTNRSAKRPSAAKAAVATMIDGLGLGAIISDPDTAKKTIVAEIDSNNPNRLNVALTVQISGNTNIISVDLNFGFFFGTDAVVSV